MIRAVAFFHKLKVASSDEILFRYAIRHCRLSAQKCPVCGAVGGHRQITPYHRWMITVQDGKRCERIVPVPMVRCSSCGHAHAILPDVLIPYSSYSLRFILTVLQSYLDRKHSVRDLCSGWEIAVSTLYTWIHQFAAQFSAWKGILHRIDWICRDALSVVQGTPAFPSGFFSRFGFSFLQCRAATPSMPVAPDTGGS